MSAIASRSTVFQASAVRSSMRAVVPKVAGARRSLRVVAQAQNEKVRMRCLVTALLWTVTKLRLSDMEMDERGHRINAGMSMGSASHIYA